MAITPIPEKTRNLIELAKQEFVRSRKIGDDEDEAFEGSLTLLLAATDDNEGIIATILWAYIIEEMHNHS